MRPPNLTAARDLWPRGGAPAKGLPPGQGVVRGFPRFGTHFDSPAPAVPPQPAIEVRGAGTASFDLPIAALQALPRRTLVADFHCVAGWSVRDLRWEGVPFRTLWEDSILPRVDAGAEITHVVFAGLDGFKSVLTLEDALADEVLVADRLDGAPLTGEHGAPARLVSPRQYGYMNTKHLSRIELRTRAPDRARHASGVRSLLLSPLAPHPRARVDREERHEFLPAWSIRFVYRRLVLPVIATRMPRRARG
jgi:DMSO/TMAO reductase YedYZ molybdopterin-dependent catalytic subunit